MGQDSEWKPKLVGLLCRWCSYAGADLAGTSRKKYPANMGVIKVPCSGRVDPLFILKALRLGFDGVLVSGCHPGDCHYQTGNYRARRRIAITKKFLEYMGIDPRRIQASWVSASEGARFAEVVTEVTKEVKEVGPNELFAREGKGHGAKVTGRG
jgi:F420-non-reducing hydrogenase iron-sulfur subunit